MNYKTTKEAGWMATGLGWVSVIIGLFSMIAPRQTARTLGVRSRPLLFRLLGLRELISGAGILNSNRKSGWLWSRVGGDAIDLALLGSATAERGSNSARIGAAMGGIGAITALDVAATLMHWPAKPVHVVRSITVDRSPEDLYGAWRNFTNLPQFMENIISINQIDERRTHWVVKAPGKTKVEWDAEILEDVPNERISWRSMAGADVDNWGTVQFTPSPSQRGTVVRVALGYLPPAGRLGSTVALLMGREPRLQVDVDLHRFEQWMETGTVTTTKGQPAGRPTSESRLYDLAAGR